MNKETKTKIIETTKTIATAAAVGAGALAGVIFLPKTAALMLTAAGLHALENRKNKKESEVQS